jgi:hypothetical protein
MRYLIVLLLITFFTSCSTISKEYYYLPENHQYKASNKERGLNTLSCEITLTDSSGKNIGTFSTSHGLGKSLFAGPLYLPVIPVFFIPSGDSDFLMDINIHCDSSNFIPTAIDIVSHNRIQDSLNARHTFTGEMLDTKECYLLINDSIKVPLLVHEYFLGQTTKYHSYRLFANFPFKKIKTFRLITGNPLLDSNIQNIVFKRKKRIAFYYECLS